MYTLLFNNNQQRLLADVLNAAFGAGIFGADVVFHVILQEVLNDIGVENTSILDVCATLHHREAVAMVDGHLAGRREGIGFVAVERLVSTCFLVQDFHLLDTAFAIDSCKAMVGVVDHG